jgi:hypothetical protein
MKLLYSVPVDSARTPLQGFQHKSFDNRGGNSFRGAALLLSTFLVLLFCSPLAAQTSEISGRISDPSKAVVSGADVSLTRTDSGEHRQAVSSGEGYYVFPLLVAGVYELSVTKQGFQKQSRTGIAVSTGQISTVDFELAVGTATESVTVTSEVPLLQGESASVNAVVENESIADMPLLDRRSSQLQRLNGFVVANGTGSGATFAIAGGRGNNANYLIDGGTAQNLTLGVPTLMFDPPVESMQEFNVSISNYAAELGRTGGGVIQMTTKSGTNRFKGSLYEYFRNNDLNTRTFFSKTIPPLRYNLFGGSLGGPIVKNKTHFFFNYEGRRQISSTNDLINVPTTLEDQGNYSADTYTVKDPTSGTAFAGNIIPASRLDPVGAALALFYPTPNVPGALSGKGNFDANDPATTNVNDYVLRIDHDFNANNRVFFRSLIEYSTTDTAPIFTAAAADPFGSQSINYYYNESGTWYHSFKPTVINEARATYTRRKAYSISAGAGTNVDARIGLTGVDQTFFPTVTVNGFQNLGNSSQQQRLQGPIRSDAYNDNLTIVHNSHVIKTGVEFRYSSNRDRYSPTAGGSFTFNNVATGSALASLELGWVDQASLLATYPILSHANSYAVFVQDDWHVNAKLTLNYGLRWDIDQPRWVEDNRQNSFNPTAINPVSGTPGIITFSGLGGLSKYAHSWDLNNFGPRLGVAYKIDDKTVVRGGGGVLYTGEYDQATPIVANIGFSTQGSFVSPDNGVTPAFLLRNGLPATSSPTTANLTPSYGAVPVGEKPTTAVQYFAPNHVNGYLYNASLDIQRQLKGGAVIDIGYLGTFGHRLPAPDAQSIDQVPTNLLGPGNTQILRPFPQFSNVQILANNIGASKYDGLSAGIEKRYSAGVSFKANYTFSKLLDNVDARNELAGYPGTDAFTNYYNQAGDWGRSGNDIRHRFVFSTVYDLPFGQTRHFHIPNKAADFLGGGWSVTAITELRSGTALSPVMLTNTTNSFSDGERPNVVGNPSLSNPTIAQWFNTAAFAAPAAYVFGDAGRTFGNGPGSVTLDSSLLKDFRFAERVTAQFRVEALNALNHPVFANPNTQFGSATFGQITSLVSGNQSRILQLGLHMQF